MARGMAWAILAVVAVMMTAEALADFLPGGWVWWTHKQAMDVGGFATIALIAVILLGRRS
jgi:hypothetical protein